MRHIPVLLHEVIDSLQLKPGMNVIDCTLGDAGHAEAILEKTAPNGKLLGIDADPESLLRAKQYLYRFGERVVYVRDNFVNLKKIVSENNFSPVHRIIMDLGWSSPQFSERGRGFSFEKDEVLDMRYDPSCHSEFSVTGGEEFSSQPTRSLVGREASLGMTASEVVNSYNKEDLVRIFKNYGEEKLSKEIAETIVEKRKTKSIERTSQLVEIILDVYRRKLHSAKEIPWIGGIHPATKVFQALRIEVNHELEVLKQVLPQAVEVLIPGGRLAVITFHSLEDRIVKHYFKSIENKLVHIITKKPVAPQPPEVAENPRARSAKLRVIEKL